MSRDDECWGPIGQGKEHKEEPKVQAQQRKSRRATGDKQVKDGKQVQRRESCDADRCDEEKAYLKRQVE